MSIPWSRRGFEPRLETLLLAAAIALFLAAPATAGFDYGEDDDETNYRKGPLSAAQKTAVQCAIDEIKNLAIAEPNAKNRATMIRLAACLQVMLNFGEICTENGKNNAKAACLPDGTCGWVGDEINVRANCISKNEPAFSKLIAVLVHEAIHALQWQRAPASDASESVAYAWEHYILCKRLESAPDEHKPAIERRKVFTKWQSDVRGSGVTGDERKKKLAECKNQKPSKAQPDKKHGQKPADSSTMQTTDPAESLIQEIQTPFDRTLDFDVGQDIFGGDILIVSGDDGSGANGGVVYYFDVDGDLLPDEITETPLGDFDGPLSLDFFEGDGTRPPLLVVFDRATHSLYTSSADAQGHPTPLDPIPFAEPGAFPFLTDMFSVRGGRLDLLQTSVIVSEFDDDTDAPDSRRVDFRLIDTDLDQIADAEELQDAFQNILDAHPHILRDVQDGDQILFAAGMAGVPLEVYVTDPDATYLGEFLGQGVAPFPLEEIPIFLSRPVFVGEFLVVVDGSTGGQVELGTAVIPSRPEIFQTDLSTYNAGEKVLVFGRNFTPASNVLISEDPTPTNFIDPMTLSFVAPDLANLPTNFFVIEVEDGGNVSNIAGIEFVGTATGVPELPVGPPQGVILAGAHPNPFREILTVSLNVPIGGREIEVCIYDVSGRRVRCLWSGSRAEGPSTLAWDGRDADDVRVPAGVYFVRLSTGEFSESRTVVLLR